MSALVKQLRLLQAWYLPAGPEPEEAMPSKYRAVKEAADRIVELERDLAVANAENAKLRKNCEAMAECKALADGMANMIRGFILKRVERETLDEVAAKYRKWEEDYCHRGP